MAGGGTGGHLFPGIAVAEEFLRRDQGAEILFVGTGRPVEAEVLGRRNLQCRSITAAGLKGKGLWGRIRSLAALPVGLFQSLTVIAGFKPDLVLGVGGYVSGPVGLAASLLGKLTAIHEQNSIPGMTNRLLGRFVDLVFISFDSSRLFFPPAKTHLTGNPIRAEITTAAAEAEYGPKKDFTLLVIGGSQGARAINHAAVGAIRILAGRGRAPRLIHQTGTADLEQVRSDYNGLPVDAEVRAFIQDMERAYAQADLVISRAGALSVAELAAMGRPAVFVPLPTAADNHQEHNARWLVEAGAAEMIRQSELTPQSLAGVIERLRKNPESLREMARRSSEAARPDAVRMIVDICQSFIERRRGRAG